MVFSNKSAKRKCAGLLTRLVSCSKAGPFSNKLKSINYRKLKDMPQKKEKQRIAPKNEIISIWLEGLLIFPKQCFSNVGNQYSKNFRDYNRNYNWNKCIYSKAKATCKYTCVII